MKKPLVVNVLFILTIIQIVFVVLFLGILMFVLFTEPHSGFWSGVERGIMKSVEGGHDRYYIAGYLTGQVFLSIIIIILILVFVIRKKFVPLIVMLSIQTVIHLSRFSVFLFVPVLFIILISTNDKAKEYFGRLSTPENADQEE